MKQTAGKVPVEHIQSQKPTAAFVDKREILPLTFFRFVTAFMVFLFHLRIHFKFDSHIALLNSGIGQNAIFTTAFFILSGFVFRYAYGGVDLLDKENLKNYYIRRFAKIYSSYFAVVVIAYVLAPFRRRQPSKIVSIPRKTAGDHSACNAVIQAGYDYKLHKVTAMKRKLDKMRDEYIAFGRKSKIRRILDAFESKMDRTALNRLKRVPRILSGND